MITLKQLKNKLHKDFGWENLESDDNKWFVDNLLKDTIQAIEVIRCCETFKDKETITFDDFVKANNYTQNFIYFYRDGKTFKPSEIMKRYKTYLQTL